MRTENSNHTTKYTPYKERDESSMVFKKRDGDQTIPYTPQYNKKVDSVEKKKEKKRKG